MGRTSEGATEQRIMEAAEELFLQKGYLLATTVKIAETAGVTHAMLHYYFRTKEQIFMKVLDRNLNELFASIRPMMKIGDAGVWENLRGGISTVFDYFNSHRRLPSLIYDVQRQNPELLDKYRKSAEAMLRGVADRHSMMLEEEMSAGRMNRVDTVQLFYSVLTMIFFTFLSIPFMEGITGGEQETLDRFIQDRKEEILQTVFYRLYGKA